MGEPFHWFVQFVVPYLNFLIFLGILVYFARTPLSQLASKRKSTFDAHHKAASEALNQAKQQLDELQNRAKVLSSEVDIMRSRGIQEAQSEAKRIVEDGKKLAQQILEDAKKMRDAEFLQAQAELERQALILVKTAVVKKLETDFNESKDHAFIEHRIKEMGELKNSSLVQAQGV